MLYILYIISFIICSLVLCGDSAYILCSLEQEQLFIFDKGFILEQVCQIGGISRLLSSFIIQFFRSPVLSIVLVAATLSLIPCLLCKIAACKNWAARIMMLIPLLPLVLSLIANEDTSYEVIVSIIILLFGIYLSILLNKRAHSTVVRVVSIVIIVLSSWICAGADMYHLFDAHTSIYAYVAILTPFLLLGIYKIIYTIGNNRRTERKSLVKIISSIVILLVSSLLAYVLSPQTNEQQCQIYKYEYLFSKKEFSRLAKEASSHMERYVDANYYNLAMSRQGLMLENLFSARQHGPSSLIFSPNDRSAGVYLARVLYESQSYAAAQNVAFNALQTRRGYSPSMLEILAEIEILRGNTRVAERYVKMLEHSLFYAQKAKHLRERINDSCWPPLEEDFFVLDPSPYLDIQRLASEHSLHSNAVNYALALNLLAKNFNYVYRYVRDCAEGLVPATPVQEALVFFVDYYATTSRQYAIEHGVSSEQFDEYNSIDLEWCRQHGVKEEVINRFYSFKRDYDAYGKRGISSYRGTFWYYLIAEVI